LRIQVGRMIWDVHRKSAGKSAVQGGFTNLLALTQYSYPTGDRANQIPTQIATAPAELAYNSRPPVLALRVEETLAPPVLPERLHLSRTSRNQTADFERAPPSAVRAIFG
jgi:hypothetical protein